MRRYIIFANIALFILFIFLGMKGSRGLIEFYRIKKGDISLTGDVQRHTKTRERTPAPVIAGMGHSIDYYDVIPEKDLFRPERKEYESPLPSEENEIQSVENEIRPPAIDLYGIMIDKQRKLALLYDKREKEQNLRYKVVSSGTEIQGYKLILIQPEQIIFEKNGRKATVKLSQAKAARGGIMTAGRKAPQIIKEEKGKGASLAVSVKKEAPSEKPSESRRGTAKEEEDVKYKIIDTPFGKLKRRIN
jgi:hypothetical protein